VLSPIASWNVEPQRQIVVREKRGANPEPRCKAVGEPEKIVIIGGGGPVLGHVMPFTAVPFFWSQ
jgi:hypothetical protein